MLPTHQHSRGLLLCSQADPRNWFLRNNLAACISDLNSQRHRVHARGATRAISSRVERALTYWPQVSANFGLFRWTVDRRAGCEFRENNVQQFSRPKIQASRLIEICI